MKDFLNYELRDQLYGYLKGELGLTEIDERYDSDAFGNFYIILASRKVLLRYINDRSYLTIEIAGQIERAKWYNLSFVRDFIYDSANINSEDHLDNETRIMKLNSFLEENWDRINDLYSDDNYLTTMSKIDTLLEKKFKERFRQ